MNAIPVDPDASGIRSNAQPLNAPTSMTRPRPKCRCRWVVRAAPASEPTFASMNARPISREDMPSRRTAKRRNTAKRIELKMFAVAVNDRFGRMIGCRKT